MQNIVVHIKIRQLVVGNSWYVLEKITVLLFKIRFWEKNVRCDFPPATSPLSLAYVPILPQSLDLIGSVLGLRSQSQRPREGRRTPVPADPERSEARGQATHLSICLPWTQTTRFHKGLRPTTSLFVSQHVAAQRETAGSHCLCFHRWRKRRGGQLSHTLKGSGGN